MWRRLSMFSAALAAITVILFFSAYWCSGWSQLNCWTREINIQTGHQRYTRYWFWCVTEQRVETTWISETLGTPAPSSTAESGWHLVVALSPSTGHSPHYIFHGALGDLKTINQLVLLIPAEKDAQRSLATSTLWLWQAFKNDSEAGAYISDVSNAALRAERLTASEVPSLKNWLLARRAKLASADLGSPYAKQLDEVISSSPAPSSP